MDYAEAEAASEATLRFRRRKCKCHQLFLGRAAESGAGCFTSHSAGSIVGVVVTDRPPHPPKNPRQRRLDADKPCYHGSIALNLKHATLLYLRIQVQFSPAACPTWAVCKGTDIRSEAFKCGAITSCVPVWGLLIDPSVLTWVATYLFGSGDIL